MKKNKRESFWEVAADVFPESSDELARIKKDIEAGRIPDPPRSLQHCHNWADAWLYIFKKIDLHSGQFLRWQEENITVAVLFGADFDKRVLTLLKKLRAQLGEDTSLRQLRLIAAGFRDSDIKWLKECFPRAEVQNFSERDVELNPDLTYANPDKSPYRQ